MKNLILGDRYYFKFKASDLDTSEVFVIWCATGNNFYYQINGGGWSTDTTTGSVSSFGVNNASQIFIKLKDGTFMYYTNEIIEINCKVTSIIPSADVNNPNYVLMCNNSINNPVELYLSTFKGDRNLVNKNSKFTNYWHIFGQFTDEVDLLNPTLLIQYDGVFDWNYIYIVDFDRYYYINGITNVRKGLWRISCHIDVLYTYSTDIPKQAGYIKRNSKNPYGIVTADDRWTFASKPSYSFTDVTGGTLANTKLTLTDSETNKFHIVLSVINENARVIYADVVKPSGVTGLSDLETSFFNNALAYNYILEPSDWQNASLEISQQQTLATFIYGAWAYPFEMTDKPTLTSLPVVKGAISIGSTTLTATGSLMAYDVSPYLIIADFTLPSFTNFYDVEPFKECSLYIPYYNGLFTFNLQRCAGHNILVYYSVQFSNGNANVYVYDYTANQVLLCAPVQLAQPLAVSTTNNYEITIQRTIAGLNAVGRGADSLVMMGLNAVSKNALGVIKYAQEFTGGLFSYGELMAQMQDTASVGVSSANGGYFNPQKVYLITKKLDSLVNDTQTFYSRNGYPINCWDVLNATGYEYTGYTEIEQMHYTPDTQTMITTSEIDEIESLARDGIIL